MFKNLTDFSYKRSGLEAVGFYLAYLFLFGLLGGLTGAVVGSIQSAMHPEIIAGLTRQQAFEKGLQAGIPVGHMASVVFMAVLVWLMLTKKDLIKNFGYLVLAIVAVLITLLTGSFLGLIPAAILSTQEKK